ncbi:MAG: GAF domain-containing protein [Bacteroidia bacterium]|nr:GAF domain-containing protein [Bacteroidia bacterium]
MWNFESLWKSLTPQKTTGNSDLYGINVDTLTATNGWQPIRYIRPELSLDDLTSEFVLSANAVSGALYQRQNDDLYSLSGRFSALTEQPEEISGKDGLVGGAIQSKRLFVYNELPENSYTIEAGAITLPIQAMVILPAIFDDEVVGFIQLFSLKTIDEKTQKWLTTQSGILGLILQVRTGLNTGGALSPQIAEQFETFKQKIQAIDTTFASISLHPDGTIVEANTIFCNLLGTDILHLKGKKITYFLADVDEELQNFNFLWENLSQQPISGVHLAFSRKNKELTWLLAQITPIQNESGNITSIQILGTDFTETITAIQSYQEMEALFKATEEQSITNIELLEGAVSEMEKQREALSNALLLGQIGPWELDIANQVLILSLEYAHLMGMEEAIEIPINQYINEWVHPEDTPILNEALQNILSQGSEADLASFIYRLRRVDGEYIYVNTRLQAYDAESQKLTGTTQDIDTICKVEIELEERNRRIEKHNQILLSLTQKDLVSIPLAETLAKLTEAAVDTLETDRSSVWFYDDAQTKISLLDLFDKDVQGHSQGMDLFAKDFPKYFEALKEERVISAEDAHIDPATAEFSEVYLTPLGINAMLDAPIRYRGKTVGVLCNEHKANSRQWTPDEVNFATSIADFISLALEADVRRQKEQEIRNLNENLEKIVEERTQELRLAQNKLIISEKMASLGQLVAGVAHEVNTPIAAIKASVRNMIRILPEIIIEAPIILSEMDDATKKVFLEMIEQALNNEPIQSTRDRRTLQREIVRTLEEEGVDNANTIASNLTEVRIYKNVENILPLLLNKDATRLIDNAYKLGQMKVNMDNISIAADKTSKIVFALKNYSHVSQEDTATPMQLAESIDNILTLYSNQTKYGVTINRNYSKCPSVLVYPDEIGQVWTNIIHNALYAMKYNGTLSIGIESDTENVIVKISDTGPGIPEDIQHRIFEPFFTTKPQGEGTGLGLDICRKIVEKHNGTVSLQSEPGNTTFTITLPQSNN